MQPLLTIGQFNDSYLPVTDGVVTVVRNYAYWLNERYGKCIVYAPNAKSFINPEPFDVQSYVSMPLLHRKPYRLGLPVLDGKYRKQVDSMAFDLVHAHSPVTAGSEALRIARKRKIPLVSTFHSKFYDDFLQYTGSAGLAQIGVDIVMKFFEKCDSVWTVSESTVDTMRSYGYKGPVTVIPNGTDLELPEDLEQACRQAEALCGLLPGQPMFLFVGQHIWQKNIRLILEAVDQLRHQTPLFKMVFVGRGYAEPEMRSFIEHHQLQDHVLLLGPEQDRAVLTNLYYRATAFVFPSLYDNAPLVVREAAALHTPSLLLRSSNASQNIVDGENGFLCENSPEGLRQAMLFCLEHPDLAAQAGEKASQTLAQTWSRIIDMVYEEYLKILYAYAKKAASKRQA